jgi:methylmalonyl-CoA mutase
MTKTTRTDSVQDTANERLLGDFEYPTYEKWREAAQKMLKGAPFEKKLFTRTYEEITLKPIYWGEDVAELKHLGGVPGQSPFIRGADLLGTSKDAWKIAQETLYATPDQVNRSLKSDIERGQTAINLLIDAAGRQGLDPDEVEAIDVGRGGQSLGTSEDIKKMLDGIDVSRFPVYIQTGASGVPVAALLAAGLKDRTAQIRGCIGNDPLGALARDGFVPRKLKALFDETAALTAWASEKSFGMQTIMVDATTYHDGGGSAVEELAFALATGLEYMRELNSRGLNVDQVAPRIRFSFSVGPNFFMEVAKLRAARLAWARIVEALGGGEAASKMQIHVRTSAWGASASDPWVNMLRGTTETFSAAIAGVDSIHTSPFDEAVRTPDEFSRRVARNTQVVLKDESRANQVIDPAGGSWFVEKLTSEVAFQAWKLFQQVESLGGMTKALGEGMPQSVVAQTASKRARDLDTRKSVLVGVNMYANLSEQKLDRVAPDQEALKAARGAVTRAQRGAGSATNELKELAGVAGAFSSDVFEKAIAAASAGATLSQLNSSLGEEKGETVEPVAVHRGSDRFEELRRIAKDYAEANGHRPQVFLANMGPIPQHKPRADFTTGFFEIGGFEVLGNNGFDTPEAAADAALKSGALIVAICSTDPTYPELVPPLARKLKAENPDISIVLAGYPKDQIEAHKESGVDEFIHLRANIYELMRSFLEKVGAAK